MSIPANVRLLMLSHQPSPITIGPFWVKSQTVTAVNGSALIGLFSFLTVPFANQPSSTAILLPVKEKRDALTDKPARELADGISGTEQNGDVRLAHARALWKSKSDLKGAVASLKQSKHDMAESGYITCLACPMGVL